ncbi:surface-adhesin E family protein [Moraxella pluranimalium]|uniref:Surface-adhesin protein E-like domain-containing protein n=1 Tax=Moraxella pluranimalium TaxID=470453 RepID=A0A1T0CX05_9GAMM|nr:surface-adhesin E family protein [Moraxella pluranimalium]OOS26866.1 hypothetical protein B0680_00070 [Moraxella pluranimalium]
MKKLLAVALATVMTQQAMAVNWVWVSENNTGKYYIDLDSIQADTLVNGTPVMTAWTQAEHKQAQGVGGKKYWAAKSFRYYDCHARKFDTEFAAIYDKQGRVVDTANNPATRYSSTNWVRVIPSTPSEAELYTVCAYAN